MCKFMSAIVMRNGDILCDPEHTDSHEELIHANNLSTTTVGERGYCRVEYAPADGDPANTDNYVLRVDEETVPRWWAKVRDDVEESLRARVGRMVIEGEVKCLLGGCWIVRGKAVIGKVRSSRIVAVRDSAQITNVGGSASISNVGGSASISNVSGSAQITNDHRVKGGE